MGTSQIQLLNVLTPEEYRKIDWFCTCHRGLEALPQLAAFLAREFSVELKLDPDIVVGFVTDQSNLPGSAVGACSPKNERACAAILRVCWAAGIPVTIAAGRSNLTGSATPQGGIVLSVAALLAPDIKVSEESRLAVAPVGMVWEEIRKKILQETEKRLFLPVDPTSRNDALVGGVVACNASGFVPGETGAVRHWVEALDLLLPNGKKVSAHRGQYISENGAFVLLDGESRIKMPVPRYRRPSIKNASGPYSSPDGVMDFVDLVVGSEGIFGLITACTLRLWPRPHDYLDLFFSLASEEDALTLLGFLRENLPGGVGCLSALEYFGINCRLYMEHEEQLFHGTNPVGIYVQVPLSGTEVETAAEQWFELLRQANCGIDEEAILLLDNERDRTVFLEARHSLPANSLEVLRRRGTHTIMTDTVVPPSRFAEFLEFSHKLLNSQKLDYLAFGHFGDCHLHFNILPERAQLQRALAAYDRLVEKSAELGGVYSGEHGTGKRKRHDFLKCYGRQAAAEVRGCKAAVDPQLLLNRGNVIEP